MSTNLDKFRDTQNPLCRINNGIEDTEHFLLLCDSFKEYRCNLLTDVYVVLSESKKSLGVWRAVEEKKYVTDIQN